MRAWVSTVVSPMKGVWPDKRVRGLIYLFVFQSMARLRCTDAGVAGSQGTCGASR